MELLKNLVFNNTKFILITLCLVFFSKSKAQCDDTEQVQPTIMVIPWTKINEDILYKIENDKNYRDVITLIKDAFIQKDFNTEDFITEYENLLKDNAISLEKFAQDEVVKQIINNTTADIVVKAELEFGTGTIGNYIGIQLTAEDIASGENLSNLPNSLSPEVRTTKYSELAKKALLEDGKIEKFLNDMNKSFTLIKEKGRTVSVRIEVSENSKITLDEEIDE
ncbi:MAG: DUF6175 family protein, partial [Flavobacteriales bacterium]